MEAEALAAAIIVKPDCVTMNTSSPNHSSLPEPLADFAATASNMSAALSRIDELHRKFVALRSAGGVPSDALEAIRVAYTFNSNAIEGSTLTLRETQMVIEGMTPTGGKPLREIYEARNHDRAVRLIEEWAGERGIQPLTQRDLLDVHAVVLCDIDQRNAGSFRTGRVMIAGSRFVPPGGHRFDTLIPSALGLAARAGVHPVLRAAEIHYNLAAIHPFVDGNGRSARLIMNALLLQHGYPLCPIDVNDREVYLTALDAANSGDLDPFARLIVESVAQSLRIFVE